MSSKVMVGSLTAVAAVLGLSVGAHAQAQELVPAGPVQMQGHISVDNRPVGGDYEFFNCKVIGQGRILEPNGGVVVIESVQALNNASGQIPMGCATVNMANLPWLLTVSGTPTQAGVVQEYTASISGVSFESPLAAGDGCEGTISGTWYENEIFAQPALGTFAYPSYSRFVADGGAMGPGNCIVNNLHLKITRLDAPRKSD